MREQIAIGAGDVVKRAVPLSLAHVKLAATLGGTAAAARHSAVTYRVVRLDGEPREIARTIAKEPEFDLSAGRYRIEAALGAQQRHRGDRDRARGRAGAEDHAAARGRQRHA